MVREAAAAGANIILLQELFSTVYFCQEQDSKYYEWAVEKENELIEHFSQLASELNVVLPISFFERANTAFYNSIVVIDADGRNLGLYRKSHIPDGPGYQVSFSPLLLPK